MIGIAGRAGRRSGSSGHGGGGSGGRKSPPVAVPLPAAAALCLICFGAGAISGLAPPLGSPGIERSGSRPAATPTTAAATGAVTAAAAGAAAAAAAAASGQPAHPAGGPALLGAPRRLASTRQHHARHDILPPAARLPARAQGGGGDADGTSGGSGSAGWAGLPDPADCARACLAQGGLAALRPPVMAGQGAPSAAPLEYVVAPSQVLSEHPRIFLFPNFISNATAARMMALAEAAGLRPSGLAWRPSETPDAMQRIRTSSDVFLSPDDDDDGGGGGVLAQVERRIAAVTMLPRSHGERFNVLRYEANQSYDSHMDTFDPAEFGPQPSQRVATVLLVLRAPDAGGETVFLREGRAGADRAVADYKSCEGGFKYAPRAGDALVFWSVRPDGAIDARALHGGCPVLRGVKVVATKWLRDKPMRPELEAAEAAAAAVAEQADAAARRKAQLRRQHGG